ncbi:MAG: hypothetical protein WCV67_18495 [Victivallaceae bacterium]|jgi:hypothetical protein
MKTLLSMGVCVLSLLTGYAADMPPMVALEGNGAWKVVAANYSAASGKNGALGSISFNGKEYISDSPKIPGGSYLCQDAVPVLENLTKTKENVITGTCALGRISYEFFNDKIVCTVEAAKDKKPVYYIIINPAAKPGKVSDTEIRLQNGADFIKITSDANLWGPWNEHMVWDLKIPGGEKKTVTIEPVKG